MGWSGSFYSGTVQDFIKNGEVERLYNCETLARSVKGNVVYSAVKDKDGSISAMVTLLRKDRDGYVMVKSVHETSGPCESECPEKILNMLSDTDAEWALAWRERCRNHKNVVRANKVKRAELDQLPIGSRIMFNGQEHKAFENVWRNTKAEGSTVFVNISNNRYSKKNQIIKHGYQVLEEKGCDKTDVDYVKGTAERFAREAFDEAVMENKADMTNYIDVCRNAFHDFIRYEFWNEEDCVIADNLIKEIIKNLIAERRKAC